MSVDLRKPFWLILGDPEQSTNWMVLDTFTTQHEAEQAREATSSKNPMMVKPGVFIYQAILKPVYPGGPT